MKKILFLLSVIILLAFAITSCDDGKTLEDTVEINYPIEVPFTELLLYSWPTYESCFLYRGKTGIKFDNTVIIVNSDDDLKDYIRYDDDAYYYMFSKTTEKLEEFACRPEIDFSRYALLLASGIADKSITKVTASLQQFSADKYKLNVEVFEAIVISYHVPNWYIALIIDKPSEESDIELNVTLKQLHGQVIGEIANEK